MAERSNRTEVRNPLADLPEVVALANLPPEVRLLVRDAFRAISSAARERGDTSWKKHKPPMAAYWKGMAVNFRHLAVRMNKSGGQP